MYVLATSNVPFACSVRCTCLVRAIHAASTLLFPAAELSCQYLRHRRTDHMRTTSNLLQLLWLARAYEQHYSLSRSHHRA